MRIPRDPLRHAARRASRCWRPVLRHSEPNDAFSRLDGWRRKRLELAALRIGLSRPDTWRAGLRLVCALLLMQVLRGYWSLDGPAWQLAQCLLALTVLPEVARSRQAILRLLLARDSCRAGGHGHGVL